MRPLDPIINALATTDRDFCHHYTALRKNGALDE